MLKIVLKGIYETRQVFLNGEELLPDRSQKVINHSPDGFAWGYGGSGPAQLALAVLLKIMEKEKAVQRYQKFKSDVIAQLPQEDFNVRIEIAWMCREETYEIFPVE